MKINGYFILDGEVKSFHVTDPKRGLDNVLFERARPHGEWKTDGTCSECGVYSSLNKDTTYFCPNCGSDNRKREGDKE